MLPNINIQKNLSNQANKDNGGWAILALFLIFINSLMIQSVLNSLDQRSNLIIKLWQPSEDIIFFSVPTFIEFCIITIWIISPKGTELKKIFRISSIIITIFYLIYLLLILALMGSK